MQIIITGANGFIGYNLYKALKEKFDCNFILYDKEFTKEFDEKCKKIQINLMNLGNEKEQLKYYIDNSDYIFHCAAICGVDYFTQNYTNSTINLLIDFNIYNLVSQSENNIKTIYFSTSEVYGSNKKCKETSNFEILNGFRGQYACEKLMGEYIFRNLRTLGKHLTIVRPFNFIGIDQDPKNGHVFSNFIKNAKDNKPLIIFNQGEDYRMYCPIEDAVNEILSIMNIDDDFNIGSNIKDNYLSVFELAQLVIKSLNSKSTIIFKNTERTQLQYRKPDINKILKFYKPKISIKDYLKNF